MILSTAALSEVLPTAPSPASLSLLSMAFSFDLLKGHQVPAHRYHWQRPSDLPDRIELFDTVEYHRVAVILALGLNDWKWERSTTMLLNGAPPIEGSSTTLATAKRKILNGLPVE
jgi:hypothetical protein